MGFEFEERDDICVVIFYELNEIIDAKVMNVVTIDSCGNIYWFLFLM